VDEHTNQVKIVSQPKTNEESSEKTLSITDAPAQYQTTFQTNQNGMLELSKTFDSIGNLKWTETYAYDSSTNLQESKRFLPNGDVSIIQYQYDTDGHRISRRMIGTNSFEISP
jgi:YD repeat-containing protein